MKTIGIAVGVSIAVLIIIAIIIIIILVCKSRFAQYTTLCIQSNLN